MASHFPECTTLSSSCWPASWCRLRRCRRSGGASRSFLPGANAMGLMVFYLFADRPFDCDALAHPAICSDGDVVVEHFGFDKFEDRVGSAVAIIIMNYVLARILLLAILIRSACRRGVAPFGVTAGR